MQAAKGGKRVAVIEAYDKIGGGCTHWGTIPSKALRFSIYSVIEAMNDPIIRELGDHLNPTFAQLRASSKSIISKHVSTRQTFYERNNVSVIQGKARFVDSRRVADKSKRISCSGQTDGPAIWKI